MILRSARIILAVVVFFNLSTAVLAQRAKSRGFNQNVRIAKDKPTVYITFENFGERASNRAGESGQGVYLRLYNNTRWSLFLQAQGASGNALATGKEQEIGMFYGVEEVRRRSSPIPESTDTSDLPRPGESSRTSEAEANAFAEAHKYDYCEVPPGVFCHFCSVIKLSPGKSLLFSLPRETLCGNLKTYISYQYDWEKDWDDNEPEHRIYFYGSDLPKANEK